MIPRAYITEWSNFVPWQTNEQVEQDLLLSRALVEIFSDDFLSSSLAFRGGTALHKLYLQPQSRYSEDINLVQISQEPIKETVQRLQERLSFLGESAVSQKKNNNTLKFRVESEFPPVQTIRIKIETNGREHFTVLGYKQFPFEVNSSWYKGSCKLTTFSIEELLGTKLRALYQRRKGRDLFDLYKALSQQKSLDHDAIVHCYKEYMRFVVENSPSQKLFLKNMEAKMKDSEFLGDIAGLIRPDEVFNQKEAYEIIKSMLIEKI